MKLATAIRRFDTQLRADGKSPHTREVYLRDLDGFRRWVRKDVNILTLTPHHLARYLTSKAFTHTVTGTPKAVISLNRSKSALRSFFRFLHDAGHVKQNPARLVKSAPCSQKPPSCLTEKEVRRLLSTIKKHRTPIAQRDYLMFALMLGTGMRLGSLVGLNVGAVDPGVGTIRINGKGNVEQVVFVNGKLKRLLKKHNVTRHSADPLFRSVRGDRIGSRQVQLRLNNWAEQAGIKHRCRVHSLRHTFATLLYKSTGDIRLVQVALGHKRVSTTEVYTRIVTDRVRRAVQQVGGRLAEGG